MERQSVRTRSRTCTIREEWARGLIFANLSTAAGNHGISGFNMRENHARII